MRLVWFLQKVAKDIEGLGEESEVNWANLDKCSLEQLGHILQMVKDKN